MADLYGGASSSPAPEPEEISTFLNQFLHSSAASSSPPPAATAETVSAFPDRRHHGELGSRVGGGNSSGNFSDPGGYFGKEWTEDNVAVSKWRGVVGENDLGDFSRCESEKGVEVPSDTIRPRSSSKRSRAAEVHNLSEKRRRSRINEKMKALQNLIPNSNKTDKASMLDEAIEYLKQLQLQVQMLTLRNGLSLHPMCLPGALPSMQLPLPGMSFDDGTGLLNSNTLTGAFSASDENLVQTVLDLPNQCSVSNQPVAAPSGSNYSAPGTSFSFEPLSQAHYGAFNLLSTSKDICREGNPHVPLDEPAKTSSSSVS